MFLVLQFPFADAREFVLDQGGRLTIPAWPIATVGKDFLRSSGPVRARRAGGLLDWPGEDLYADATNALKFPDLLGNIKINVGSAEFTLRCIFRRFHSNGIVARLELGLKITIQSWPYPDALDISSVLRKVLELPIRVKNHNSPGKNTRLIEAGELLAQHFLNTTMSRRSTSIEKPMSWWFSAGVPSVIVESDMSLALPPQVRRIDGLALQEVELSHSWLQFGKQRCSGWFIQGVIDDRNTLRKLRIHLVRLHAERECLRCILVHLRHPGRLTINKSTQLADAVQQYLKDAIHLLNKSERYGFDQTKTREMVQYAFDTAFEGETASLVQMRRQIAANVRGYIQESRNTPRVINHIQVDYMETIIEMGNVSVSGNFNLVTAKYIKESFNNAATSSADDELKKKLGALTTQVAELAKSLPQDDAEQVARDLKSLTDEAVSKKPRKAQYEVSADGLLSAAKTVAEMTGPITTAVRAVLSLLG